MIFFEQSKDIKSSEGYEQQAIKLVCIFGAFLVYMPLKILILAEYQGMFYLQSDFLDIRSILILDI